MKGPKNNNNNNKGPKKQMKGPKNNNNNNKGPKKQMKGPNNNNNNNNKGPQFQALAALDLAALDQKTWPGKGKGLQNQMR